jgi:subtilisin-like proprotein convertase family protein
VLALVLAFGAYAQTRTGANSAFKDLEPRSRDQISLLQDEKRSRSWFHKKLDSQLVYALRQKRLGAVLPGVSALRARLSLEPSGSLLVDVRAQVSPELLDFIRRNGGTVVNSFPRYHAVRAMLPLEATDSLARRADVRWIRPAEQAITSTTAVEGDIAHRAAEARQAFAIDGTGVKIGVLSDSIDYLATAQAADDLPLVTVLPGQAGSGSGEGTAMLEIVHSLAPGASLYFATANAGIASFAQNIRDLQAAGCRIIVDDVLYFSESPFQDSPIAQAVNDVSAAGVLFFSAAGNGGGLDRGTSGTWEGDFKDGGPATSGRGGRVHDFGGGTNYNTVLPGSTFQRIDLFWADPLGNSTNDYDVYVLNSSGSVVSSSTNPQEGPGYDPYESISDLSVGEQIVIVKYSGEDRYLYLSTLRGRLQFATAGSTHGHCASGAPNAFSVTATPVASPPVPFVGGSANAVESFSSDGPRRIFFNPDGSAITPGNYSSTGGKILQKPDLTAADGVSTSVPGFPTFSGTSAAAPHAAAIAGLVLSYNPLLSPDSVRSILTRTSLEIAGPGWDQDSGAGIVMAYPALVGATPIQIASVQLIDANGNGSLDPNECADIVVTLTNTSGQTMSGLSAVLTSPVPEITIDPAPRSFADLPPGGAAAANIPFRISTSPLLVCGTNVAFVLQLVAINQKTFKEAFQVGSRADGAGTPLGFGSTNVPLPIPDLGTIESSLTVAGVRLPLANVKVSVYITHPYDSDLSFSLVGPDGTEVLLSSGNGQSGQNYGAGCAEMTVFSDDGANSIGAGLPPFLGTFAPEQPLAAFFGKTGSAVNGIWKLRVSDQIVQDVGTLQCWSLELSPITCFDGGGQCLVPPTVTQSPADVVATSGDTVVLTVQANGTGPLSYQWYFNATNLLAGATNASLVLSAVGLAQEGSYAVVVSNLYGSVTSAPANVAVIVPPALIGWFRVGDGPAWSAAPPCYSAREAAALLFGGPVSQYAVSTDPNNMNLLAWVDGWGDTTYLNTPASDDFKGGVLYTNRGSYSAYVGDHLYLSPSKTNYVWRAFNPMIIGQPQNQVAVIGGGATLQVSAIGAANLSYQWYFNTTNLLAGATSPTLVLSPVVPAEAGGYQVVVSNARGSVTSAPASLVVVVLALTCGSNRTVEVGTAWDFDTPTATGSNATVTVVGTVTNLGCGQTLSATRTWLVSDPQGHQATCSQTVQVVDTEAPVVSCVTNKGVVLGTPWSFDVPQAQAGGVVPVLVYDNWTNDLGSTLQAGTEEVGNQITLAETQRYARRFALEYWGSNVVGAAFGGPVSAEVRFYANDGPVVGNNPAAPGTLIYDSGPLGISATPREAIVLEEFALSALAPLANALPDSFTWTVQFAGMAVNDVVGLSLFGPPVGGQVLDGYWARGAGGWQRQGQGGGGFGGQLSAVSRGVELTVVNTVTNADCGNGFSATRTWQARDACGNSATCSQTVQVVDQGPPVILSQPQDITVVTGQAATLGVGVRSCPPLGYQWYFNQTNVVAGATNATLVLSSVVSGEAGSYTVVITNEFGRVTSSPAVVTVVLPLPLTGWFRVGDGPAWSTAPPCYSAREAAVLLFGGTLSQYAVSTDPDSINLMAWVDGWGDTTYLTTPASEDFKGSVLYNSAGSYSAYVNDHLYLSQNKTNYVWYAVAPVIIEQPQDQVTVIGGGATFQVSAIGSANLSYQWYLNETNLVADGTNAVLQLSNVNPAQLGSYVVVVSNTHGSATSAPAQLQVLMPAIVSGPADQVATNGQTAALSVVAVGSKPLTYQWYFNATNLLAGATDATLVLNSVVPGEAGHYEVVVSNAYGSVTSAPASLVVIVLTLTCGSNRTVEVGTAWDFDTPTATGSNATVTVVGTVTNLGCGETFSATRTWLVSDPQGNQATCSQTVQVLDTGAPVMSCVANKSVVLGTPWGFDVPQAQDAGVVPVLVYDNWTNDLGSALAVGAEEVGNQITLAGTERYSSRFALQYWGSNTVGAVFGGPVSAQVRFYANDGSAVGNNAVAPGTPIYDSGPLGINATPNGVIVLEEFELSALVPLTNALPDSFTWTVQFAGMAANDVVGLSLFGPPVAGQSLDGYWARGSNGWQWQGQGGGSFGGQLSAVSRGVGLTVDNTVTNADCGNGFSATRTWRARDACGNNAACSQTVQVVDQGPPVILSQPQDVTVVAGRAGMLEVSVRSCPPLGYQWYFNQTNVVADATNATLVLSPVVLGEAGSYAVVITNGYGSVTSSPAMVTVVVPARILSNPVDVVATNGDTVEFTVQGDGNGPLLYQWYFNQTNLLADGTNAVLHLSNVSPAQAGIYTVVLTNAYGSVTSTPATLTVFSPPVIVSQPQAQTVTAGSVAVFVISATGNPAPAYQWLWNGTNSLAGANGPMLMLSNVQDTQAGLYSVVVSNLIGSVISVPVALTINGAAPTITAQPIGITTMAGQTVGFSVTASGAQPLAYQWYANCTSPIAGSTNSTLRLKDVTPTDSANYCVAVSNSYGSVLSQPATLRVLVRPGSFTITQSPQGGSLTFPTVTNLLYTVYASDDPGTNGWTLLPGAFQQHGTGAPMTVLDPLVPQVHRFYKVIVE